LLKFEETFDAETKASVNDLLETNEELMEEVVLKLITLCTTVKDKYQ